MNGHSRDGKIGRSRSRDGGCSGCPFCVRRKAVQARFFVLFGPVGEMWAGLSGRQSGEQVIRADQNPAGKGTS